MPEASGVFFGLTLSTGKAELVRAVLESIGFMLRENLELLRSLGVDAKRVHFFGGGSKNAFWNQMIADITGTELVLMEQNECGSMGAAMLAAVQMGDWETITEAQRCNRIAQIVHPNAQVHAVYEPFYRRYQQVFQCNEILFQKGTKSI
ncbi:MAG: FGGY-family carbohydrate kinase [Christensenellales bacterium]